MSYPSTSKRTLAGLRDDSHRLCLFATHHDERLREVLRALEAARDENRTLPQAFDLAQRALHSGSQLQEMAQSLLARLEAEVAERAPPGADPITAVLVVDDLEDARVLTRGSIATRARESLTRPFDADNESPRSSDEGPRQHRRAASVTTVGTSWCRRIRGARTDIRASRLAVMHGGLL